MATSDARALLPEHLEPIEVTHQRSVLSVTAFIFDDSVVGPYTEIMFSVIVPPMVAQWGQHAKAGFYPFLAATSSEEARRIKADRFHFPYHEQSIDAQFIETDEQIRIRVFGAEQPILDLSVTQGDWETTTHLLQGFMMNGEERLRTTLQISGDYTVHENEGGRMTLFPHPITADLFHHEVPPQPFREHWFKNGTEVFHVLETI
ncbi:MAG: hypothetical protein OXU39_00610 [Gemmatimonadota bacterium]|nr:hypothetical protein [Gemmatimonadota bacterium]MDE3004586.1 hypothetical protein [Gemmatimonadota bacterium]